MSDGYFEHAEAILPVEDVCAEPPSMRDVGGTAPCIDCITDALPKLGSALWLSRSQPDGVFPRARLLPRGVVLLDHPALNAFAHARSVHAFGALTSHGPREWLEFRETNKRVVAKLFLLPDTDVYAWDRMLDGCRVESLQPARDCAGVYAALMRAALARSRESWHARIVRLPLLRLIGLRVLGLRAPDRICALSHEAAAAIAREERAVLLQG